MATREVGEISARFLSEDERVELAYLNRAGGSVRDIARRLDRVPATISRDCAAMPVRRRVVARSTRTGGRPLGGRAAIAGASR